MSKNIQKIFEKNGFVVEQEETWFGIYQYTPAGEDWCFTADSLEKAIEYAENYDKDDDFSMWVTAKRNGSIQNIPAIDELYKDALWKEKKLAKVVKDYYK